MLNLIQHPEVNQRDSGSSPEWSYMRNLRFYANCSKSTGPFATLRVVWLCYNFF